ncbi:MAG TPA: hypothetical protein VGF94_24940 [Kofleriaceae bacterium]
MRRQLIVLVVAVVAVPSVARAGLWYYAWRCSGQCAPNQLAITGEEGPFASYADCEAARSRDGRSATFIAAGNLGGLDNCAERGYGASPAVEQRTTVLQRLRVGLVGGAGWHVADAAGNDSRGGTTLGFDFDAVFGPHAGFGFELGVGAQHFSVTAPVYANTSREMFIYPWVLGLTSSPALWRDRLRLDLAADILYLYRSCDGCNDGAGTGYGGQLRAGLDYYRGDYAIGFTGVWMWASLGNTSDPVEPTMAQVNAPTLVYELSLTWRNSNLAW